MRMVNYFFNTRGVKSRLFYLPAKKKETVYLLSFPSTCSMALNSPFWMCAKWFTSSNLREAKIGGASARGMLWPDILTGRSIDGMVLISRERSLGFEQVVCGPRPPWQSRKMQIYPTEQPQREVSPRRGAAGLWRKMDQLYAGWLEMGREGGCELLVGGTDRKSVV